MANMVEVRRLVESLIKGTPLQQKRVGSDGTFIKEKQDQRPHPELLAPGVTVTSPAYDEPFKYYYDHKKKILHAPYSNFDEYGNVRAALMVGLKISPNLEALAAKEGVSVDALRAFELVRGAIYADELELIDDPCLNKNTLEWVLTSNPWVRMNSEWLAFSRILSRIALVPCAIPETAKISESGKAMNLIAHFQGKMGQGFSIVVAEGSGAAKNLLEESIQAFAAAPKSIKGSIEAARILNPMVPQSTRPRKSAGSETRPGNKLDEAKKEKNKSKACTIPYLKGRDSQWGEMKIVKLNLCRDLNGKIRGVRKRCAQEGIIPIRMDRFLSDQMVFQVKRHIPGGTLVIDHSGSMSLSVAQIEAICKLLPAATIAVYEGSHNTGELRIIAKNGKIASTQDLRSKWGGNVVDFPALQWLAKQDGPRIWVSDQGVIGIGNFDSAKGLAQCLALCKIAGILPARTLQDAIAIALELRIQAEMEA